MATSSLPPLSSVPASRRARVSRAPHLAARRPRNRAGRGHDDAVESRARPSREPGGARCRRHRRSSSWRALRAPRRLRRPRRRGLIANTTTPDGRTPSTSRNRRLEIRRMVLAALTDDDVLRPAADEQLAVGDVTEIARVAASRRAMSRRWHRGPRSSPASPTVRARRYGRRGGRAARHRPSFTIRTSWPGNGRPHPTMRTAGEPFCDRDRDATRGPVARHRRESTTMPSCAHGDGQRVLGQPVAGHEGRRPEAG